MNKYRIYSFICPGLGQIIAKRYQHGILQISLFISSVIIAIIGIVKVAIWNGNNIVAAMDMSKRLQPFEYSNLWFIAIGFLLWISVTIWSIIDTPDTKKSKLPPPPPQK